MKEILIAIAILVFFIIQGLSNAENLDAKNFILTIEQGLVSGIIAFVFTLSVNLITKSKKESIKYTVFIAICFFVGAGSMLIKSFVLGTEAKAFGFVILVSFFATGMVVGVLIKQITGFRF